MTEILHSYGKLLQTVEEWFRRSVEQTGASVACRSGCSECCRALFDITLLDACYLKSGFDKLSSIQKEAALARAKDRLFLLQSAWPEFDAPYLLNHRPDEEWAQLMPEDDETPCALLDSDGRCLVYEHRPMTCRLHGMPLVDVSGEVFFEEWCSLNFVGEDPLQREDLRWEFDRLFSDELQLFRKFTEQLLGIPVNELDTFIPTALLIDFAGYDWQKLTGEGGFIERMSKISSTALELPSPGDLLP